MRVKRRFLSLGLVFSAVPYTVFAGEEPGDAAPSEPSVAETVQAMISAQPTAETLAEMPQEEQGAVYAVLQEAYL